MSRPSWDQYFMGIVDKVAERGTCDRGQSGSVIVKDKRIMTTGYVGSPPGQPHCDDEGHLFKKVIDENGNVKQHCVRTLHAEENAMLQAAEFGIPIKGATLYCTMTPCYNCAMRAVRVGIRRVVAKRRYHAEGPSLELFKSAGVKFEVQEDRVQEYSNQGSPEKSSPTEVRAEDFFSGNPNSMRIIKPSFKIEDEINGEKLLKNIESYARTCYKSEDKITEDSAENFIRRILRSGHESVIEHEKITVRIICDRAVTHEIVRHRLASYSQESTRYCDYQKSGSIQVIEPFFFKNDLQKYKEWEKAMQAAEDSYNHLRDLGASPQEARSVLPNSLKTEIIVTYNLREWRHFFKLRCSKASHPQMREVAVPILKEFQNKIPVFFDDFEIAEDGQSAVMKGF
jgi:thymidylate synthase (FAD)